MVSHKNIASESEQMYLISIARLIEDGIEGPVPLTALADALSIQPVSVNQMARKMEEAGLLVYQPYKGVELTPCGQTIAARILRYRRLWEIFLIEHLKLSMEESETLACRMEHETNEEVASRLTQFLNDPVISPNGRVIPNMKSIESERAWLPLSDLQVDKKGQVVLVEADPVTGLFLSGEGIRPGTMLTVLGIGSSGHILLKLAEKNVDLSKRVAEQIIVQPNEN
jgi:DtxR family Mn-dependent transcriptional regulator